MLDTKYNSQSNSIATYNYVDIITGTGIIELYIAKTVDKQVLTNFSFYSDTVSSPAYTTAGTGAAAKVADLDFDVLVNKPLTLQGTGIVQVAIKITHSGAAGGSYQPYIIAKLRKWDGTTETEIASNQSKTFYTASNGDAGWGNGLVYDIGAIDLTVPLTVFKKGEYIRLTLELWGYCDATAPGEIRLGWDPKNRSKYKTEWDSSALSSPSLSLLQLPTRLDID